MVGVGYGRSDTTVKLNALQEQEVMKELKIELNRGQAFAPPFKYLALGLDKGSIIERHNILIVEFIKNNNIATTAN